MIEKHNALMMDKIDAGNRVRKKEREETYSQKVYRGSGVIHVIEDQGYRVVLHVADDGDVKIISIMEE